jgi:glycosyltransferase involved in cell wall biosynthesis
MAAQDYPADRILWIVLDNSDRPEDGWENPTERVDGQRTVAWMRNRCIELALETYCDYIVFWDDDDYYPPKRISVGVDALESDFTKDIAASSKMFMLLTKENVMMTTGPFHDSHGTAATFTIRRPYADRNRFDPSKTKGEEPTFTKGWTARMVHVSPEDTIVVMGHSRNTVDKSDLLRRPQMYCAKIINDANGKMWMRSRWPVPWDLFRSTFSA